MTKPLAGKSAIVTGASRGIGREIALKLASLGASVVVNYANSADYADEVCSQIQSAGGKAVAVKADIKDTKQIEDMFDTAIEQFGSVDILVNNAGTVLYKKLEDISEQEFDDLFDCNVKGIFFACQQAAKRMNDGGHIINLSSTVTKLMMPTYSAYAATKGAVDQITRILAKELGPKNIKVNAISPGPVETELFMKGKTEEQVQFLANMSAFGRLGQPEDIANTVALLVSDEAGWITGQNICANGGMIA